MREIYYKLLDKKIVTTDSIVDWDSWFETANRHIGDTTIKDQRISTVFLGIDHNYGTGKPILFETMIFGGDNDMYCKRYHTYEEAEKGHQKIVRAITQGEKLDDD